MSSQRQTGRQRTGFCWEASNHDSRLTREASEQTLFREAVSGPVPALPGIWGTPVHEKPSLGKAPSPSKWRRLMAAPHVPMRPKRANLERGSVRSRDRKNSGCSESIKPNLTARLPLSLPRSTCILLLQGASWE